MMFSYQFDKCAIILEKEGHAMRREFLCKLISIMRSILFSKAKIKYDMISFQRCCSAVAKQFTMMEKFVKVMAGLYEKNKLRAQKKIYFWWIPICYDTRRTCGRNMLEVNYKKFCALSA